MTFSLYNTLSQSVEPFNPLKSPDVKMYVCGPTVYDYTHIGHIRTFIAADVLRRSLTYCGYNVRHVMNITDVGHLTGDSDEGIDKLEKGAKKTGKTVWEVASFYTDHFTRTMKLVNVIPPTITAKATEHVPQMIELIKKLEQKGHTYQTAEALYFSVETFPAYGRLSRQKLTDKRQAVREDVKTDPEKRNPADFSLWFFRKGRFADHAMHWDSPWGDGFPGWHIECSAMSMTHLGESLDIHTGGIDHIPVHHENEIAQSEAATGKPFVKYWVHFNHLQVEGQKMSKSLGNYYTIDDIIARGINPRALRLLFLQTHYRQEMNFTWESVQAAASAYSRLLQRTQELRTLHTRTTLSEEKLEKINTYTHAFKSALASDLQIPQAIAVLWEVLKSNIPSEDKRDLVAEFDQVLGLDLMEEKTITIPEHIENLIKQRASAKEKKDYKTADALRTQIENAGYILKDTAQGTTVTPQ